MPSSPAPHPTPPSWSAAGSNSKMTQTPVRSSFSASRPHHPEYAHHQHLQSSRNTFFVGQLSTSASGAVGVVSSLMAIIQALGFMLGHGAGGIISRSLGSQDTHAATKFASTSFFTALTFGAVLAVLGLADLPDFMMLLGSTDTILPHACAYARPILIAAPLMMSSLVMNNILRYEGKASFAMIGLVTGGVLNIVLDPVFIFGLGMGTGGAGTATALSQSISFCILLSMFLRGKTVSRFRITQVTRSARDFGQIFFNGAPSFGRQGLNSIGSMLLNVAARSYGDARRGRQASCPHLPVRAVGGDRRRTGPAACGGLQLRRRRFAQVRKAVHLHHLDGFRLLWRCSTLSAGSTPSPSSASSAMTPKSPPWLCPPCGISASPCSYSPSSS